MLDAIASIFVRNEEVVAVAFSGSIIVAIQEQAVVATTGGEPGSANAKQSDAGQSDTEQSDSAANDETDFD